MFYKEKLIQFLRLESWVRQEQIGQSWKILISSEILKLTVLQLENAKYVDFKIETGFLKFSGL